MPAARGDDGETLSEASRLLQEGLQLLAARTAEADQQVAAARAQAEHILAEAEGRRDELEAQVELLQAQVERARAELARVRGDTAATLPDGSDRARRWGRPSSISPAQEGLHVRAGRPRWLPRWLRA